MRTEHEHTRTVNGDKWVVRTFDEFEGGWWFTARRFDGRGVTFTPAGRTRWEGPCEVYEPFGSEGEALIAAVARIAARR